MKEIKTDNKHERRMLELWERAAKMSEDEGNLYLPDNFTPKPTCPKCGVLIHDDEPAYVMPPYDGYCCEACWRGTSRAYRRYAAPRSGASDPYESYLRQRRVTTAAALVMMAALLLAVVILTIFVKSR